KFSTDRLGHRRVVDDARVRCVQCGETGRVRLDVADTGGRYAAQSWYTVGDTTAFEFVEAWQFVVVHRDDELAAPFVGNPLFLCVLVHQGSTFNAQSGLEGTRLVVDAPVNDAGVVAGLVHGHIALALDHHH